MVPGGAGEGRPHERSAFQLSPWEDDKFPACGEETGSVRGQWEVFVEKSSAKERWKVLESAGLRVLGSKEEPALKEKGRVRKADSLTESRGSKAREGGMRLGMQAGRACKKDGDCN